MSATMRLPIRRAALFVVAALLLIAGVPNSAQAAPGQRLVLELDDHPVRIYYQRDDERVAKRVAEIYVDRIDELCDQLGLSSSPPIEIDVVDDIGAYSRRFGNDLPTWGVAFALMGQGRMVVDVARATRAWNSLESVIPHELSHLLVAARTAGVPLPLWFVEGLAQWQAGEWSMIDSWQLMNAVWSNQAPKLWRLQNQYPVGEEAARSAYRISYAAFTRLFEGRTDDVPAFLDEAVRRADFKEAFVEFFGEYPMSFYVRFHDQIQAKYHSRLLVFQSGPLFSILAAAFLVLGIRFFLRKRRRLKEMADETAGSGWPGDGDGAP